MTARLRRVAHRLHHGLRAGVVAATALLLLATSAAVAAGRWATAPLDGADPYVLLVIGSDKGPPRDATVLEGNADAQHLLVVSPDRQHASILTFPRDTWVDMVGRGRKAKINSDMKEGGGIEPQVASIEQLVGLEVDDWIVTGFNSFDNAIDELGGVTIDVERRLRDPRGAASDLQPGVQTLRGYDTLAYSRDRNSRPNGDLGRVRAHANVLVDLHAQLFAADLDLAETVRHVDILRRHTVSSMPPQRMLQLAGLALEIDPANVHQQTLPARLGTVGNQSVVLMTGGADAVFADLRDDGILNDADSNPFNG